MTFKEIKNKAKELEMTAETIDKDWVLGHFLNAMYSFPDIKENFVFKGGTCLRKIYFQDYRFSEDLDFTLTDKAFNINDLFFKKIIKLAELNSGAKFYLKRIKPQVHNDNPQGYEITILFWGAYHKPNQALLPVARWQTKIKLDISFSETVLLTPEKRQIFHAYPDSEKVNSTIPVYPLNEIVAEKLRSLMQRNRPRDIFDLNYLFDIIKTKDYADILKLLRRKSESKNIYCCRIEDFINSRKYKRNKRAWESSLTYHLPIGKLVGYDIAYSRVEQFVEKILNQTR